MMTKMMTMMTDIKCPYCEGIILPTLEYTGWSERRDFVGFECDDIMNCGAVWDSNGKSYSEE